MEEKIVTFVEGPVDSALGTKPQAWVLIGVAPAQGASLRVKIEWVTRKKKNKLVFTKGGMDKYGLWE